MTKLKLVLSERYSLTLSTEDYPDLSEPVDEGVTLK